MFLEINPEGIVPGKYKNIGVVKIYPGKGPTGRSCLTAGSPFLPKGILCVDLG